MYWSTSQPQFTLRFWDNSNWLHNPLHHEAIAQPLQPQARLFKVLIRPKLVQKKVKFKYIFCQRVGAHTWPGKCKIDQTIFSVLAWRDWFPFLSTTYGSLYLTSKLWIKCFEILPYHSDIWLSEVGSNELHLLRNIYLSKFLKKLYF